MVIRKFIHSASVFFLKSIDYHSLFSLQKNGPLKEDGWFRSFREGVPIDSLGNPLPWITYPAIEFLKKRIHRDMSVFEYGCGKSTLWWASRIKDVISVENDEEWYRKMAPLMPGNATLYMIKLEYGGDYSKKILEYENQFDIIVIDGRDRVNCAINSLRALKPEGVILWDNSDRAEYETGYRFLYDNGFRKIEFTGYTPVITMKNETGIFYRPNNALGI